jgi:UTP--glucose-1-phosphate uridylyltransferase
MPIKKAIFPVAGYGTRFLPATKAQPKEMLPIVDKPIIQYLVEEAVEAGIENIIFVTGRGKSSIENHFDHSVELDVKLLAKNKMKLAEEVNRISDLANFAYVRQPVQNGDGAAILCAKPFLDPDESVLVVFPDYIMPGENKTLSKMLEYYDKYQKPIIAADRVDEKMVDQYGVIDYSETHVDEIVKIDSFVEKPPINKAPSNLINAGYAVITPKLIKLLVSADSTHKDGEIRLADAFIQLLSEGDQLYALVPNKPGYDCGSKIGFVKATVDYALQRDDLREEFTSFLQQRSSELKNTSQPKKKKLSK